MCFNLIQLGSSICALKEEVEWQVSACRPSEIVSGYSGQSIKQKEETKV